jgi:hypothetical protein
LDNTARIWDAFPDTQALVSRAKADVPRCLTQDQRKSFLLPPEPPAWCIEAEKWPYTTPIWRRWLADVRAGKNPPLPAATPHTVAACFGGQHFKRSLNIHDIHTCTVASLSVARL